MKRIFSIGVSTDFFKRVPKDLTEPTLLGSLLSILTIFLSLFLFFSELRDYNSVSIKSSMAVEKPGDEQQKIQINLDVFMKKIPCDIVSFDAQDVMGNRDVDARGHLFKERIDKNGTMIEKIEAYSNNHNNNRLMNQHHPLIMFSAGTGSVAMVGGHPYPGEKSEIAQRIENEEGCRIQGYILVNKVPGHIHISSNIFGGITNSIEKTRKSVEHRVNHFSFGGTDDVDFVLRNFRAKTSAVVNPLDGIENGDNKALVFEYYMKVVPTTFISLNSRYVSHIYQMTANHNSVDTGMFPALYFRYDYSPIHVKFEEVKESFLSLLVRVFAIIGGIFSVIGMLNIILQDSIKSLLHKHQIGKLG